MKRVIPLFLLVAAAGPGQEPSGPGHRIQLFDRTELAGEIMGFEAPGNLLYRSERNSRVRRIPVEEVARFQFAPRPVLKPQPGAERARLYHGVRLTGKLLGYSADTARIETSSGTFRVPRAGLKTLALGPLKGDPPELTDEKHDILIYEAAAKAPKEGEPKRKLGAAYGRLVSVDKDVVFRVREGKPVREEERRFDRASVRRVYFHHGEAPAELPPGWFAKILFRNGDKIVGTLRSVSADRLTVFSHVFGVVAADPARVHSVAFVQDARMTVGNILLCELQRVRELDRQGKELWSYDNRINSPWCARKLENGNVLIANTNMNEVIEVRPTGSRGGEVVWRLQNCQFPRDAVRLENGNTLVAEYYRNRVAEYDHDTKQVMWQHSVRYPASVQRLRNGHTFIATRQQVMEVDRDGNEKWRANLNGVRPLRARRLENGHTLITDQSRHQVYEIDLDSEEVWRKGELSRPVQAIRLEDGNTLILEQGHQRIIEIDPDDPRGIVRQIKVPHAQGMTIY